MNFLIVDDEQYALEELNNMLTTLRPDCTATSCRSARLALDAAHREYYDIAFLDIELGVSNGILLAKQLKDIHPQLHIIFTTSHAHYAIDAFAIHATGYLLKPIQKSHLERELTFLYGERDTSSQRICVKTFGEFSVYIDGEKTIFKRNKAKELFAYLIERNGASVTIREACAILFENEPYDRNMKNYFHTILGELKKTLAAVDADDVLVKAYNSISILPEKIDCDYYRFLAGDPQAVNDYHGEFMNSYSWAEFSNGVLYNTKFGNR